MTGKRQPGRPDREVFDEPLERALSWAARPEARREFKDSLREQFLAGAAMRGEQGTAVASRNAALRPPTARAPVLHARADQVRRVRTWAAVAAVAASVVIVGMIWRARSAPWRMVRGTGAQLVQADGTKVPLTLESQLAELLASSRTVETADGAVELRLGDDCLLAILPNSRVVLPVPGTRNDVGPLELRVEQGGVSVATGPTIAKRGMHVLTDHLDAEIVGTSFGVDRYAEYSCLCCLHGTVKVKSQAGVTTPVGDGRRCMVRKEGEPSEGDAYGPHMAPVVEVDTHAKAIWK